MIYFQFDVSEELVIAELLKSMKLKSWFNDLWEQEVHGESFVDRWLATSLQTNTMAMPKSADLSLYSHSTGPWLLTR